MDYPHRIRLRGPWECEPLLRLPASDVLLPPRCRMTMPCRWNLGGLPDFAGRVRFRRRFSFPGRLDPFERVWLTFDGAEMTAEVWLNGQFLGQHTGDGAFEFEIQSLLQVRNELIVEVTGQAERGGLWGEVALEVRCAAFLRGLAVNAEIQGDIARLHVHGMVVGTAERPLELYALLDDRTIVYATAEATPEGQAFHFISEELPPERWRPGARHRVRVDLVNVATVWYQWEQFFAFAIPQTASEGR